MDKGLGMIGGRKWGMRKTSMTSDIAHEHHELLVSHGEKKGLNDYNLPDAIVPFVSTPAVNSVWRGLLWPMT